MRLLVLCALLAVGCAPSPVSPGAPADARSALALAEDAWLQAYVDHDRDAMALALADGFTITFPDGSVQTRADVIGALRPGSPADDTPHFTEDREIRVLGTTAILTGVYVNPGDGRPDVRMRYTDTWMWRDGRWQVVASHLSAAGR